MDSRIIHIANDEKFINSANSQFEDSFPKKNIFYIIKNHHEEKLRHVNESENTQIIKDNEGIGSLIESITTKDIVFFHSLTEKFYPILVSLPKETVTVWFCFGFEVYNDKNYFSPFKLYDAITRKLFYYQEPILIKIKILVYNFIFFRNKNGDNKLAKSKHEVFKRINYLGCSFSEEKLSVEKLINLKKNEFPFWYYPLEKIVDVNDIVEINKPNILIGNSGTITNNHLDVFEKIKHYDLNKRKVIVPLSYGDLVYIEKIKCFGDNFFKDKFQPLLEFYSIKEYNEILKSCGVAIINSRRQQAVGNTIALLWLGVKVYLSKKNTFYRYLKRMNFIIFNYEEELNNQSFSHLLSKSEIEKNRELLMLLFGSEILKRQLYDTINSVVSKNNKSI